MRIDDLGELISRTLENSEEVHCLASNTKHVSGGRGVIEIQRDVPGRDDDSRVVYHIANWAADSEIPVLYIHLYNDGRYVTELDDIYSQLVPDDYSDMLKQQQVGFQGSLTQGEHPIFGYPVFYIHPCQTREFIDTLRGENCDGTHVLYLWLQTFGRMVGLDLPPAYTSYE